MTHRPTLFSVQLRQTPRTLVAGALLALVLLGLVPAVYAALVTEDFEAESSGTTTFSENGLDFATTGDLIVTNFSNFGCESTTQFLDTGYSDGNTVGSAGKISLTTPDKTFKVSSLCAWTSNNDGGMDASGDVTFTGTLAGGGTVSEVITVSPTGTSGSNWDIIDFTGTNLENAAITELEFTLSSGINYIAIDNIEFEALGPTAIALQSVDSASAATHPAHLMFLLLIVAAGSVAVSHQVRRRSRSARTGGR